jgi:transposase
MKHGGGSLTMWGCVSYHGVGKLVLIEGTMTGEKYVKILQENLLASAEEMGLSTNFVFQQDNDPKHKSKIARKFFEENKIDLLNWPSQSPDLNIIENVWSEIKREYANCNVTSKKAAWEKIQEIWKKVSKDYLKKLVRSIYSRYIEVCESKDGATKY